MITRRLALVLAPVLVGLNFLVAPADAATTVTTVAADPAFGTAGLAQDASMTWLRGPQPAVLANNTYFVGGYKTAANQVIGVDAYTLSGQPVAGYGTAGVATVDTAAANFFGAGFTATSTTVDDIGADSSGRVSLAGYASDTTTTYYFVLRFNAAGVLDASFATSGVYAAATISTNPAGAAWIDTNPDGTSAVRVDVTTAPTFYFFKLSAAGVLDTTYGVAGLTTPSCLDSLNNPWIDLQPAGDVFTDCFPTGGGGPQIVHLLANGAQDSAFGVAGITQMPNGGLGVTDMVARPGGGYYVAGLRGLDDLTTHTATQARPMIAALNANGTVDTSFATAGAVVLPVATLNHALSFSALTLDSTGRLLVLASGLAPDSYLLRYSSAGTLDTSFGDSAGYQTLAGAGAGLNAGFISAVSATTVLTYQDTGLRQLTLTDQTVASATPAADPDPLAATGPQHVWLLTELGVGLTLAGLLLVRVRRRSS